ncbi:MAG: zinc-binding dehydrogenase [Dehalococcoidia bacterium]
MRAMLLRGKQLTIEDVERPAPGPGQVLARVRACGICGSDLHFARYAENRVQAAKSNEPTGWAGLDLGNGVAMGHEFVAEVVQTGDGVEGWTPGQRVTSIPAILPANGQQGPQSIAYSSSYPGGYGEYLLLSAPLLLPVPEHLSDRVAATAEPCAVGLHAVREARIQPDEPAFVMGAGPIGLMTLLWLKREGVQHVTVSDPSEPRRSLAERLGADHILDPSDATAIAQMMQTTGAAPPVVFECVGVPGTLQGAMDLVARRGRVIVVGVCMVEDQLMPLTGITKHLTLQFVLGYSPAEFEESLSALADGSIDPSPMITRSVSLDELPAAFESLSDPRDCKVMLEFR